VYNLIIFTYLTSDSQGENQISESLQHLKKSYKKTKHKLRNLIRDNKAKEATAAGSSSQVKIAKELPPAEVMELQKNLLELEENIRENTRRIKISESEASPQSLKALTEFSELTRISSAAVVAVTERSSASHEVNARLMMERMEAQNELNRVHQRDMAENQRKISENIATVSDNNRKIVSFALGGFALGMETFQKSQTLVSIPFFLNNT
jgi:hypothetical protein